MSGHSRWDPIRADQLPQDQSMVEFLDGYMTALDDLLQNLDDMETAYVGGTLLMQSIIRLIRAVMDRVKETRNLVQEKVDRG